MTSSRTTAWSIQISILSSFMVLVLVFLKFGSTLDEEHLLGGLLTVPYLLLALLSHKRQHHKANRVILLLSTIAVACIGLVFLVQDFFFPARGSFSGFILIGLNVIVWGSLFFVGLLTWCLDLYFSRKKVSADNSQNQVGDQGD
jgi:hypothetical protein